MGIGVTKIRDLENLAQVCDYHRKSGRAIVLASGCFDLFHAGHALLLHEASKLGARLVVAINSDESVHNLKGPGRPVCGEEDRCLVLAGMACVDYVTVFDEPDVAAVIAALRPAVWVKGDDVTEESLPTEEKAALEACGTRIVFLPRKPGLSTTNLVNKSRNND
jgi:D-beta-D-heptose 7-phosphate kinase/D-beta-D-heptose 1-phosphate adenosyltransferase